MKETDIDILIQMAEYANRAVSYSKLAVSWDILRVSLPELVSFLSPLLE